MTITHDELQSVLNYDQISGIFTWAVNKNSRAMKGYIAGYQEKNGGYLQIVINKKTYRAHRLAWFYVYGYMPKQIDHINRIKSDNRIINLRVCTTQENSRNTKVNSKNTSGFKGVTFNKDKGKYQASTKINGKGKHLGLFNTAKEAGECYDNFVKNNHGEFYHGKN